MPGGLRIAGFRAFRGLGLKGFKGEGLKALAFGGLGSLGRLRLKALRVWVLGLGLGMRVTRKTTIRPAARIAERGSGFRQGLF